MGQFFWATEMGYICVQSLAKMSILLFYGRVFPLKWFQGTLYVSIAFVLLHFIVFLMILTFQCTPVAFVWDRSLQGKCLPITAVSYVGGGLAIFEDMFILALPIPCLYKLQMSRRKRITLCVMFSIGSL